MVGITEFRLMCNGFHLHDSDVSTPNCTIAYTMSAFNMMLIVEYVPLKQSHSIKSNRIIFILKSM